MDHSQHDCNVNFIWSIADDELRDVYVRGKYRDVILPMPLRDFLSEGEPSKTTSDTNGLNSQSRNKSGKNLLFPRSTA